MKQQNTNWPKKGLLAAVALFSAAFSLLIGCGGGGGGGTTPGASPVNIFITDDLHTGYDAVWSTIYKMELRNTAGTSVTVFDDPAGQTVNLRALNDGSARFLFLSTSQIPDGTYTKVEVYADRNLTLFPTGATTGTAAVYDPALNTGASQSKLEMSLTPNVTASGGTIDIAVDFDLKTWTFAGGVVFPVVRRHDGSGMDDNSRHESHDYEGTVSNLAGSVPFQTFTMTKEGRSTNVSTTDLTSIYLGHGTPTTLANGQRVKVRGFFNRTTQTLEAARIRVDDGSSNSDDKEVKGKATELNADAGTLKLSADEVEGFQPPANYVNIASTGTTLYLSKSGSSISKADFFATLASLGANAYAEAEGQYNSTSNTLTARKMKIEDDHDGSGGGGTGGGEDEAKGASFDPSAEAGTFKITATEHEGFTLPDGNVVPVRMNPGAEYKADGSVTKAAFFEALAAGSKTVKIHGTWSESVFLADRAEIKN